MIGAYMEENKTETNENELDWELSQEEIDLLDGMQCKL